MKFNKTSQTIIKTEELGYLKIREFQFNPNSENPITDFMSTPFFCWKEEFRNEVEVTINNQKQVIDWNFHGLYDIKNLIPTHFKKITFQEFTNHFKDSVKSKIGEDIKLLEIESEINRLVCYKSNFYIITDLNNDFHHEWTVFDYFTTGFKADSSTNILTTVEFGYD